MKAQSRCDIAFRGILVCNIYVGDNSAYYNKVGFDGCVGGGGGRIMIAGREKISKESQTVVNYYRLGFSAYLFTSCYKDKQRIPNGSKLLPFGIYSLSFHVLLSVLFLWGGLGNI